MFDHPYRDNVVELGIGTTVKIARRHKVIALFSQVNDRVEASRRSGAESERRRSALEGSKALLQDVRGRIHDTG